MFIIGRRSDNGVEAREPHLWAADGFFVRPSEKTLKTTNGHASRKPVRVRRVQVSETGLET